MSANNATTGQEHGQQGTISAQRPQQAARSHD